MVTQSLNVIALISGGKDSLYTILHCVQHDHNVVALANLHPKVSNNGHVDASEDEEINSFMYQTVGHNIIPLYGAALQLPLYRQQITGTSTQLSRDYDTRLITHSRDETEDLVPLLKKVMNHHPEANAICSGAILSTYQRTRIESVALRLGLVPLAYLWQYPFLPAPPSRPDSLTGLLEDMAFAGCDSRIIKIASGGILDDLLWANVTTLRSMKHVVSSMARFFEEDEPGLRGAVLGEGGEFETLALDGPRLVWKQRIDVNAEKNLVMSEKGEVKWIKLGPARLVKMDEDSGAKSPNNLVPVPSAVDPQFEHIADLAVRIPDLPARCIDTADNAFVNSSTLFESIRRTHQLSSKSYTLTIANITSHDVTGDASHQMEQIIKDVKNTLIDMSTTHHIEPPLSPASIISTAILLSTMASFPFINRTYFQLFPAGLPNPPARVTVACSLAPNVLVSFSCVISLRPRGIIRGLHVQSRSYWAPANIGPYSQAICVPVHPDETNYGSEFVHVAGQIPLVPATMEMLEAPFVDQAALALQHLWRVGQERGVDLWTWGVAFLPQTNDDRMKQLPQVAAEGWKAAHMTAIDGKPVHQNFSDTENEEDGEDAGLSAWDMKYNRARAGQVMPTVGKHRHALPNMAAITTPANRVWVPPIVVAQVEELPRSAPIEWHSHGLGGLPKRPRSTPRARWISYVHDWGTVDLCSYVPHVTNQSSSCDVDEADDGHSTSIVERADHHFVTVQVKQNAFSGLTTKSHNLEQVLEHLLPELSAEPRKQFSLVHGTAYVALEQGEAAFAAFGGLDAYSGVAIVPCRQLWGKSHELATNADPSLANLGLALTLRIDSFAMA